jgi:hypothetical protein
MRVRIPPPLFTEEWLNQDKQKPEKGPYRLFPDALYAGGVENRYFLRLDCSDRKSEPG